MVDLDLVHDRAPQSFEGFVGPIVAVSRNGIIEPQSLADEWSDASSIILVSSATSDRRCVQVDDVDAAAALIASNVANHPVAASICDDVLRSESSGVSTMAGLLTESLAYSSLQAGPEFLRWLRERSPSYHQQLDPVVIRRTDNHLDVTFNRPAAHNAFSNALRGGLLDGLAIALSDTSVESFALSGRGPSFCSGGDLNEFGLFTDPAHAHLARTRFSPALLINRLSERLQENAVAHVHGAVLGSGLEMASFFGRVVADPASRFGLPELALGLIPGAGGTVSIPRRIGRWRTAYLILSGKQIDAGTALSWGLIDAIAPVSHT